MAFFKRVLDHLLNQVLVDSLANSRWFQKFAVWSHLSIKDLSEKGKGGATAMDSHFSQWSQAAKEQGEKWRKEFTQELSKVQQQMKDEQSRLKK